MATSRAAARSQRSKVARAPRAHEVATQVALETVAEGGPLARVLEFLCRTMEDESVDRVIACIHPLTEDATMFRDTAAPSLNRSYRQATDGVLVSSMTGPCCYAAATRQTVIVPEVAADPRWVKFREFAEPLGIRSCWSTPIFSNEGKVLGTFAHYYFEARDPSPRDKRMVELLTRAAAVAIERSRAEGALRELTETLEQRVQAETRERLQIWNVSQDLLVIAGLDGKYLSVNPAWTATLGWSKADLLGKSSQWLVHPDDRERTRAELDHLAKGQKTLRFENRLSAKDGSYHWISWKAASDSGRICSMGRDITESKRAQDALNQARAELAHMARVTTLSALTASIAHDVNQPVAAVITSAGACLRWLNRDQPEVQRAREAVMRIEEDAKRAAEIIAHLKPFYKKDVALQREMVRVNDIVGEMPVLLRSEADCHSVVMRTELAAGLPSVNADRVQLQQVLMNLMLNGMEAMSERGGELTISTRRRGGVVIVSVSDTGMGIPTDKTEEIFNAFFTTRVGGTGMGLAISRTIIESHGGRLWATGTPGRGATFHFTLPTEPEA